MSADRPNFATSTRTREDEDARTREEATASIARAWESRLTPNERACFAFLLARWQGRTDGADHIAATYEDILDGTTLFRRQIKRALDGLEALQLIQRVGFVKGQRGHPRAAYRVRNVVIECDGERTTISRGG
jgi:hypothetical protein